MAPVVKTTRSVKSVQVIGGRKYRTLTIARTAGIKVSLSDIQVSADRVEWLSGGRHTTVLRDDAKMITVRDNTPITQDHKRFIRLKR